MTSITKEIKATNGQRFIVYKKLGQGGMGAAYAAAVCENGARIGLKMVPAYNPKDPDDLERAIENAKSLREEAKNLSKIRAKCADYFLCTEELVQAESNPLPIDDPNNPDIYLIMEYILGMDLNKYTARNPLKTGNGLVGRDERDDLAIQLVKGLNAMHEQGVAHQDIKEPNIMWDLSSDKARFIDFGTGMRKSVSSSEWEWGGYMGTFYTSSPEFNDPSFDTTDPIDYPSNYPVKRLDEDDMDKIWAGYTKGPYNLASSAWKTAVAHDIWSIGVILLNWYGFDNIQLRFPVLDSTGADTGETVPFSHLSQAAIDSLIDKNVNKLKNRFGNNLLHLLLEKNPHTRLENWLYAMQLVDAHISVYWQTDTYKRTLIAPALAAEPSFNEARIMCYKTQPKTTAPAATQSPSKVNVAPAAATRRRSSGKVNVAPAAAKRKRSSTGTVKKSSGRVSGYNLYTKNLHAQNKRIDFKTSAAMWKALSAAEKDQWNRNAVEQNKTKGAASAPVKVAPMKSGAGTGAVKLLEQDIRDTYTLEDVLLLANEYGFDTSDSLEKMIRRIAIRHSKKL